MLACLFIVSNHMNKHLSKIKTKPAFTKWIMKNYFNHERNLESKWFSFSVTNKNVLEYVSEAKNQFPLTPMQLANMWTTVQSFKKGYKKNEKAIDKLYSELEDRDDAKERVTNNAEHTLEEIGKTLGGITATMINRLSTTGIDKFKTMTFNKKFVNMTDEEERLHVQAIDTYRERAAVQYVTMLDESKGNLNKFFGMLTKAGKLTDKEVELILPDEYALILELFALETEEKVKYLLHDIQKDGNLLKTYQSLVAKEAFPTKKRGRPRKNP